MSISFKAASARPVLGLRPVRAQRAAPVAAYGEDSKYFDLNDLDNTVGAWDMYGQEDTKRYPDMQNEFFERAAGGLASRGAMLRFCAVASAGALLTWGALGSAQAGLPITKGPQTKGENGAGGKAGRL
eukprot:jgi/Ulvmu1/9402/UM051_0030.1